MSRRREVILLALVLVAFGLPSRASGEDFAVEATVNATRVGIDDDLELIVSIRGDTLGRAGSPKLPQLEGFRLGGQSQSTSIQWINGRMSSTRSIIYRLIPQKQGKFVIGPIAVEYQGQDYFTDPIEIEVVAGSVTPRRSGRGGSVPTDPFDMLSPFRRRQQRPSPKGKVFVVAELSKPSAYVGEQILLTYKLYTQVQIMGLQVEEQPSLRGFWVEDVDMPQEPEWKETSVNGERFYVVEIKKSILFPTKAGKITIEPAVFSMGLRAASDPFDVFAPLTETIRRRTKPVSLDVKPLPAKGKPPDFSGAVGRFHFDAKLDRQDVKAGEPLTLSVEVEGEGNLKTIEAPKLPPLPGFRSYEPKTVEELNSKEARFSGKKRWEYVLIPDAAGRQQIGTMKFSYFDPSKKRYVVLQAGPLTLDVSPAPLAVGGSAGASRGAVQVLRRDIRYLKPAPSRIGVAEAPFYRTPWFYGSLLLPLLWNLGLVAYRRKKQSEAAHESLWRARRAKRAAQARLKQARKKARSESKEFYEETAAALYRYVADKLGVSASGLTTGRIDAMLDERGVPQSMRSAFLKTIENCEFARFTPAQGDRAEMEALLDRTEGLLQSMEKVLE